MNWEKVATYIETKAGHYQDQANLRATLPEVEQAEVQRYDTLAELARMLAGAIRLGLTR
jgi:hypothetical protein